MTVKIPSMISNSDSGRSLIKPSFDITFSGTVETKRSCNMLSLLHYFYLAPSRADENRMSNCSAKIGVEYFLFILNPGYPFGSYFKYEPFPFPIALFHISTHQQSSSCNKYIDIHREHYYIWPAGKNAVSDEEFLPAGAHRAGVTASRCLGDKGFLDIACRKASAAGNLLGPRLLVATRGIRAPHGHGFVGYPFGGVE